MPTNMAEPDDRNPPRLPWETPQLKCLGDIQSATRGGLGVQLESGGGGASFEVLTS